MRRPTLLEVEAVVLTTIILAGWATWFAGWFR